MLNLTDDQATLIISHCSYSNTIDHNKWSMPTTLPKRWNYLKSVKCYINEYTWNTYPKDGVESEKCPFLGTTTKQIKCHVPVQKTCKKRPKSNLLVRNVISNTWPYHLEYIIYYLKTHDLPFPVPNLQQSYYLYSKTDQLIMNGKFMMNPTEEV